MTRLLRRRGRTAVRDPHGSTSSCPAPTGRQSTAIVINCTSSPGPKGFPELGDRLPKGDVPNILRSE